ncbi:MAG TPA: DUF6496 domain-containing protein [Acetobacteraceae bacterium]|nr:DUF6496 domain-containing protein [Acetobacteraceae bacterium]
MATHETPEQQVTVRRVMHEFKHGELERSRGGKVKNPKQAVAIALSEAGASNQQSPQENRKRLRRSKQKERRGQTAQAEKEGPWRARRTLTATQRAASRRGKRAAGGKTRKQLYQEAARKHVRGRSRMSKAELQQALHH